MPWTPRKQRGGSRLPRTPRTTVKRLDGFFDDNQWWCNCTPRLPGVQLVVKKNGPNKGKRFWTCQQERRKQCKFFLWADDAEIREKNALLNTSWSEPPAAHPFQQVRFESPQPPEAEAADTIPPTIATPRRRLFQGLAGANAQSGYNTGDASTDSEAEEDITRAIGRAMAKGKGKQRELSPPPLRSSLREQSSATLTGGSGPSSLGISGAASISAPPSAKRKYELMQLDDTGSDEFGSLDSDEERQMATLADESARKHAESFERDEMSPSRGRATRLAAAQRNGAVDGDAYTTPSAQRSHDVLGGIPTPVSRHTLLIASEERERNAKRLKTSDASAPGAGAAGASTTGAGTGSSDDYDITGQVLSLLRDQTIDDTTRHAVRDALNTFTLRMKGLDRGRELARSALKSRDDRIAELQARITALENERKMERERTRELKGRVMDLWQKID